MLVCYPYLVIHITNRIIGVARNYTVVLTRLRRILRGYLHFMLVLLSVHGIFEDEWWFSSVEELNYHHPKITKRELLHLSDGSHHQVLRRAELIDLAQFAGSEVKLRNSSGKMWITFPLFPLAFVRERGVFACAFLPLACLWKLW